VQKKVKRSNDEDIAKSNRFALTVIIVHFYLEYVRPADMYTFLAPLRIGGIVLLWCIFIWVVRCSKTALKDNLIKLYALLLIEMALYVPFATNNYSAYQSVATLAFILIGGVLPVAALVNDYPKARRFFFHWIIINFILTIVVVKNGGIGTGSFLADENDVGLAIAMAFPYPLYLSFSRSYSTRTRVLLRGVVIIMMMAAVYTRSRGALVGMAAVWFAIWIMSSHRLRNIAIFVISACIFGGVVFSILPAGYVDRMTTASDPNNDTRVERLYSWHIAWVTYLHNPIFGVGPGNYPWHVVEYEKEVPRPRGQPSVAGRASHSFYFTVLPELGTFGAVIIGSMIFIIWRRMRHVIQLSKSGTHGAEQAEWFSLLAKALLGSLVGFLSAGAFITVVYYPHLWFLVGFSLVVYGIAAKSDGNTPRVR
jgi:O-antigen ligase